MRQALGAFELDSRGNWICRKTVSIRGDDCIVTVERGTIFHPHTAFAGYDDFPEHLHEIAVESPPLAPHEWT
jgi:hypothetical protein